MDAHPAKYGPELGLHPRGAVQVVHDVDSWRRMFVTSVSEGSTVRMQKLRRSERENLDVKGRRTDAGNKGEGEACGGGD